MKRRLLSAFLAVMMVLTMAPVAFAADDDGVKSYDELVTAISKASDKDTIKLANDITLTDTLSITKNVTLDGQGHTISGTVPSNKSFISVQIPNDGDFTMTNCVIVPSGKVTSNAAINLSVNGKVSVTNCTFSAESDTAGYMYNGLEFSQTYAMGDTNITGNTFYGDAFCHNCISFYKMVENANINISDNNFVDLNWDTTNAIRVSNYTSANATITLNGNSYSTHGPDTGKNYAGLLIFQITNNKDDLTKLNVVVNDLKTDFDGQLYYTYKDGVGLTSENEAVFHGDDSIAKYFVAKVGDTYYKTLSAAVAAAQSGETVKLLANIAEGATIPADKTVTLDLNGKNIKPTTGDAIVNKGNLTIVGSGEVAAQNGGSAAIANFPGATANVNGGTFVSAHWYVIKNLGNMTIDGPVTIKKPDGNTDTSSLIDNGWYGSTDKVAGESVSAQADKAKLTIKSGKFTGKSGSASCSVIKNDDYATLDISGGTFDSTNNQNTSNATTILNWNVATISGGTFIGQYPLANGAYNNAADKGQFTISGGTFTGLQSLFGYGQGGDGVGKITITDGNFAAPAFGDWGSAYTMEISGGYFTTDPSKYLATYTDAQKKYIAKAVTGDYKFHVELADANDLQVVPVAGATAAPSKDELKNNKDIPSDQVDNIVTAAKAVSAPEISKAAQEVAANISDNSNTLDKQYQDAAKNEVPNQEKIEVRTYLDVEPKAYNESAYTLDITPKYDVVVVGTKDGAAAEKVVASDTLKVTNATNVSIQLPADFVANTDTLYVQHKGHEYDAAVTANNGVYTANFTNPDGFSEFTISKTSQSVAKVGNNKYTTFQDAVNAVENNGTIEIVGGNKDYTATISGSSKTIKVKNSLTGENIKVTVNGESKTIKPSEDATFTYTKPSSSSSGGSSSGKTTYKVTTSAVNNGGVNASPSNAEKGATITLTLSPDKGYKLDKLTVTDGSGKSVSTVKKSDTVYTFTMPASAVTVGVSYAKADETPSKTKFNDVSANDWFASAVDYVTGKGMMNGTAANTFSPKANTTRGMLMTVLARHAGEDTTGGSVWYEKGMNWAKANGVSDGTNPQVNITREQLAAMLYRYAQNKKYDVSGAKSLDGYTDAQSVSSYAVPALQWANAAGVVNGKSGSKLDPKGYATRAEVAAMLMRFCENVEK